MNIKKWETEKFFALIKLLNKKYPDYKVLVFEGILEHEKIKIPSELKTIKTIINNDVLSRCDIFISADTGSLHIAAAFGVSTVSIFGPSNPELLSPVNVKGSGSKHNIVWNKLPCSPCYTPATAVDKKNSKYWKGSSFICHLGTIECMKSIKPNSVFKAVEDIIRFLNNHNTKLPARRKIAKSLQYH
jgi:ADP-heptose:LPS heptosyltransferase